MQEKLKSAVIGVGYLGKFHAQKYASHPHAELVAVCDTDADISNDLALQLKTTAFTDFQSLAEHVDLVSIVTPTRSHYEIAKFFLEHGVHVLVEKPITTTVEEAQALITIAAAKKLKFQVGHLERFNPVLKALDHVLDNPRFIESTRLSPFKPRGTDVNVVLDLMIHDIDILQSIIHSPIQHIDANGLPVLSKEIDIANARIHFENGCVANVTASRVSFKAERKLKIFQHDSYSAVDLQHKTLSVHRKGEGEMFPGIPDILSDEQSFDQGDALYDEIDAFIDAIQNDKTPIVSGEDGLRALDTAIRITDIVTEQLKKNALTA